MSDEQSRAADRAARLLDGHRKSDLRKRTIAIGFIAAFAIASILGASKILVLRNHKGGNGVPTPKNATTSYTFRLTPALANGEKSGAAVTPPVTVSIYEDFLCAGCAELEKTSAGFLRKEVKAGRINLEYHPFTFLVGASTNRYAERAANAAACVADDAGVLAYLEFHDELFAKQPKEGTAGPEDDALITMAKKAGTGDVAACIEDEKFGQWVSDAALKGQDQGVTTAPAVAVNGSLLQVKGSNGQPEIPGPADLKKAIALAGG